MVTVYTSVYGNAGNKAMFEWQQMFFMRKGRIG